MKRITVLYLLMLLIFPSFGQNVSILDASLKWNIGLECIDDGPIHPYDIWSTSFLHTEGDTLMNEKHYKKLISCADSLCGKKSLKFYIREEAGRVFLANKTEELLQYDFNMQKGDTMIMYFLQLHDLPYCIRVDSVKSLVWSDKKERITQYVTVFEYYRGTIGGYSLNDVLVEGIGSTKFGIEYQYGMFFTTGGGCGHALLCYYSGDNIIYSNPEINKCYLSTGVQQLLKQPELVQVLTNNHGILEIQLTEAKSGKLFVFDINGKLISGQTVNHSGCLFCLPSSGVYLYRFVSDKGKVQTGKVMAE